VHEEVESPAHGALDLLVALPMDLFVSRGSQLPAPFCSRSLPPFVASVCCLADTSSWSAGDFCCVNGGLGSAC
jgi:hypothetical protein